MEVFCVERATLFDKNHMIFFELFLLLAVAVFIFMRLFGVFGQNPTPKKQPARIITLRPKEVKIKKPKPVKSSFYPGFDESRFLEEVATAFKKILDAYHGNNTKQLKAMVTPTLFKTAFGAPATTKPSEVCLLSAVIAHKEIKKNVATIDVLFTAQQVLQGECITSEDTWTFRRALKSAAPKWMLSAIQDK